MKSRIRKILKGLECRSDCELSVVFTEDVEISELNQRYLNRSGPTDVIAFPMIGESDAEINPHLLGDVIISVETAARQASEQNCPVEDEIDVLLVHGILHLLGYDHEKGELQAERMWRKQSELLTYLSLPFT